MLELQSLLNCLGFTVFGMSECQIQNTHKRISFQNIMLCKLVNGVARSLLKRLLGFEIPKCVCVFAIIPLLVLNVFTLGLAANGFSQGHVRLMVTLLTYH